MWNLTQRFAFGYFAGGVVVSFISCFLLRSNDFAFWQLCAGYIITACLSGVIYGGASKMLGYPKSSLIDRRFALFSGIACTFIEFAISTAIHSFEVGRILLFALPVGAALVYTMRARKEWRRRVLNGVNGTLESGEAENVSGLPN